MANGRDVTRQDNAVCCELDNTSGRKQVGSTVNRFLSGLSPASITVLALVLTAIIAAADILVGPRVSLSIVYLIPVAIAAWYVGLGLSIVFSVLCSFLLAWIASEEPGLTAFTVWNSVAHLGFLHVVAMLLTTLRSHLEIEKSLARNDQLTGVMNRRALLEQLDLIFNLALRQSSPLTLAYIDLDRFKDVNDTHGHKAGDASLRVVATALVEYCRRTDLIGRLGGDEFIIVLPDTDPRAARAMLGNVNDVIRKANPHAWPISCSIGVVTFVIMPGSASDAISLADSCMYEVKHRGKDGVSFIVYDRRARETR